MHVIAAKAVAFGEALKPEFKEYAQQVKDNANALAVSLQNNGLDIVSGSTANHSMLVDLRPKKATGKRAEAALGRSNITCNKKRYPRLTRKSRLSPPVFAWAHPAATSRGFGVEEFTEIGNLISEVMDGLMVANDDDANSAVEDAVRAKVVEMTDKFPMYPYM